eukprot:TRINITY_DN6797_c0_g1_i2.p2 TRINITY_DN6797_c0_g1~~TRINITY_DN6797_c0_g1_i2.p2  ORF type:complete len:121 (-),score=12.98 TRINITY_DN6797_c0_g1_i2:20-382(-)
MYCGNFSQTKYYLGRKQNQSRVFFGNYVILKIKIMQSNRQYQIHQFQEIQKQGGILKKMINGEIDFDLLFSWVNKRDEQWPDFGCEGIKVQRAHQPTSQCQGKNGEIDFYLQSIEPVVEA